MLCFSVTFHQRRTHEPRSTQPNQDATNLGPNNDSWTLSPLSGSSEGSKFLAGGTGMAQISERRRTGATLPRRCFFRVSWPSLRTSPPSRGRDKENHSAWRPSHRTAGRLTLQHSNHFEGGREPRRKRCDSPLHLHVRRNRAERAASIGQSVGLLPGVLPRSRVPGNIGNRDSITPPSKPRHWPSALHASPSPRRPGQEARAEEAKGDRFSLSPYSTFAFPACFVALVSLDTHPPAARARSPYHAEAAWSVIMAGDGEERDGALGEVLTVQCLYTPPSPGESPP